MHLVPVIYEQGAVSVMLLTKSWTWFEHSQCFWLAAVLSWLTKICKAIATGDPSPLPFFLSPIPCQMYIFKECAGVCTSPYLFDMMHTKLHNNGCSFSFLAGAKCSKIKIQFHASKGGQLTEIWLICTFKESRVDCKRECSSCRDWCCSFNCASWVSDASRALQMKISLGLSTMKRNYLL